MTNSLYSTDSSANTGSLGDTDSFIYAEFQTDNRFNNSYSLFYTYNSGHYYPDILRQPFSLSGYTSLALEMVRRVLLRTY